MDLENLKAIYGKETLYAIDGDPDLKEDNGIVESKSKAPEKAQETPIAVDSPLSTENVSIEPDTSIIPIEGANKQKTIVVVNDKSQGLIKETNKAFLEKILSAAKLSLNDIAICNNSINGITVEAVSKQTPVEKVILFGPGAFEVGIKDAQIPKYELKTNKGISFLCCDNLEIIQADQNKKKALWLGLQRMFQL